MLLLLLAACIGAPDCTVPAHVLDSLTSELGDGSALDTPSVDSLLRTAQRVSDAYAGCPAANELNDLAFELSAVSDRQRNRP